MKAPVLRSGVRRLPYRRPPAPLPLVVALASAFGVVKPAQAQANNLQVLNSGGTPVTSTQISVNGARTDITTGTVRGSTAFNAFSRFEVASGNTVNVHIPTAANTVVNLVQNAITVNGTVNAVKNGAIGGHAVFASPDGMVVGPNGVINAGRVSVHTPQRAEFDRITGNIGNATGDALTERLVAGQMPRSGTGLIRVEGQINAIEGVRLDAGATVNVTATGAVRAGADAAQATGLRAAVNAGSANAPVVMRQVGGVIEIVAEGAVNLAAGSRLDASHRGAGTLAAGEGTGGSISVTGQTVTVAGTVDASGRRGGGSVRIGTIPGRVYDAQSELEAALRADPNFNAAGESLLSTDPTGANGAGTTTADSTEPGAARVITRAVTLASTGLVQANATEQGHGGTIVYGSQASSAGAPSSEMTLIQGTSEARGAGAGGNGGSIEYLGSRVRIDATAVTDRSAAGGGVAGTTVLGAQSFRVAAGANEAYDCSVDCTVTTGTLQNLLGGGNLTLRAANAFGTATIDILDGVDVDLTAVMTSPDRVFRLQSEDITLREGARIRTGGGKLILSGLGSPDATVSLFTDTPLEVQTQAQKPLEYLALGGTSGGTVTLRRNAAIITRPPRNGGSGDGRTGDMGGAAGDVILRGERIDLQEGSGIYAQGDGTHAGGRVEITSYSAANHYLVISETDSSITLAGTVRARQIDATAMAYAGAAGNQEKFAMQALGLLGGISAAVEIARADATTRVTGTATLQADADINLSALTTTDANISMKMFATNNLQNAVALAAAYAETGGSASTLIEGGSITAGGKLGVLALNSATAISKVKMFSLAGAPINAGFSMIKTDNSAVAEVTGGTISAAAVDIQAFQVGNTFNNLKMQIISPKAEEGGPANSDSDGLGVGGAVSLSNLTSRAKLGVDLSNVGQVTVLSDTTTWQNYNAVSTGFTDKVPAAVKFAAKGYLAKAPGKAGAIGQYIGTSFENALARNNTNGQFTVPFQASATMALAMNTLNASAEVMPGTTIDASGNVAVVARTENHNTRNISVAKTKGKDDVGVTISAAVGVGFYEHNASVVIGQGADITGANIGLLSESLQPLDVLWDDQFDIRNRPAKLIKALKPPSFGLPQYVLTSYVSATSKAKDGGDDGTSVGLAGAVNWTQFKNNTSTWVAPEAKLTATAAVDATWELNIRRPDAPLAQVDPELDDNLVAPPSGNTTATAQLLCSFEADPAACLASAELPPGKVVVYGVFPVDEPPPVLGVVLKDKLSFDRSLSVRADSDTFAITAAGNAAGLIPKPGSVSGDVAVGASVNVLKTEHKVAAVVDQAARLTAASTIEVDARANDALVALVPSGGKGDQAAVTLLGGVILTDNQVRALTDSTAVVASRNFVQNAHQNITAVNLALAFTQSSSAAVGVGLAYNDVRTDTQSRIGTDVGTSDPWLRQGRSVTAPVLPAPAERGVRVSDTFSVDAQTQGTVVALGVMASDTANDDPNTYYGPDKKPSRLDNFKDSASKLKAQATTAIDNKRNALADKLKSIPKIGDTLSKQVAVKEGKDPKPTESEFDINVAVSANAAVNTARHVTRAVVEDATLGARNTATDTPRFTVAVLEQVNAIGASGAGAISRGKDPNVSTKAGGSGAVAINIVANTAEAVVRRSTVSDFGALDVLAERKGENVSVGLGLTASSGGTQGDTQSVGLAVSASVSAVDNTLQALVERSTLTGATGGNSDVQVYARDSTLTGVGGGSISVKQNKGVGATVAVGLINSDVTAAIRGGRISQVDDVTVGAFDPTTLVSAAAAGAINSAGDGANKPSISINGSVAVNFAATTTRAEITSAAVQGQPNERADIDAGGTVTVVSSDQPTQAVQAAFNAHHARFAAGAPRGEGTAEADEDRTDFGQGFLANTTDSGQPNISAQKEGPEGDPDNSSPAVTWDTTRAGSVLVGIAGNVNIQGNSAGVGLAVSVSDKHHIAEVYDADVDAASMAVSAKASTLGVNVGVGVAVSTDNSSFAAMGSGAATVNNNRTHALLGREGTTTTVNLSGSADDALRVSAEDETQNWTVGGNVVVSTKGKAALGLALAVGTSEASTHAKVEHVTVRLPDGGARVDASSKTDIFSLALSGGAAPSGTAFNGSFTYNEVGTSTLARIGTGADIEAEGVVVRAGDTSDAADRDSRIFSLAGTGNGGGDAAIGAAVNINVIQMRNEAVVSGARVSTGAGGLRQRALSNGEIWAAAISVGASGKLAFNGASANSGVDNVTVAENIGSDIDSTGDVELVALDASNSRLLSLGLALGGNGAGGAAISVNAQASETRATLRGNPSDTDAAVDARNVKVQADTNGSIGVIAVGLGGSKEAAVAGSISVNVINNSTVAEIDGGARVDADHNVLVQARDRGEIASLAGGIAISVNTFSAAVGASASANVIKSSTQALVGKATDTAVTVVNARAADANDRLTVGNGQLTQQVVYDGFESAENYAAPTLTEATREVTGLAVNASSIRHVKSMGLTGALSASIGAGVAGNLGAQVVAGDTTARIEKARINVDRTVVTGTSDASVVLPDGTTRPRSTTAVSYNSVTGAGQQVDVQASSHQYSANFALAGAGSGLIAATGAVSVDVNQADTIAEVRNAEVDAGGRLSVNASSTGGLAGVVMSVAGAGAVAGAGTIEVAVTKGLTRAGLYDAEVYARSIDIDASSRTGAKFVVGAGAVSAGVGAGAGSVIVAVSEQTTLAEIDGSLTAGRSGLKRRVVADSQGGQAEGDGSITVDAVTDVRNAEVVLAVAGSSGTAVAGVIDVSVHASTTQALVRQADLQASGRNRGVAVQNQDRTGGEVPVVDGGIRVRAEDRGNILRAAGSAGVSWGGGGGASGAVSIMVARSEALASVSGSIVQAPKLEVESLNRKQIDSYAIGLGAGTDAGVGGTFSLIMLGTAPSSGPEALQAFTGSGKGGSSLDLAGRATASLDGVFEVRETNDDGVEGRNEKALEARTRSDILGGASTRTNVGSLLSSSGANSSKALLSDSIVRVGALDIDARSETSIINGSGALGVGGAVGVGGSIGLTFVNNAVEAGLVRSLVRPQTEGGLQPDVTLSAVAANLQRGSSYTVDNGDNDVACGLDTTVCGVTVAGGGGGFVGFGAAIAHATLNNQVYAHLDGDVQGNDVTVEATDGSKAELFTLGAGVGLVAAGVSSATAERNGEVRAEINPDVGNTGRGAAFTPTSSKEGLGGTWVQASGDVRVAATTSGRLETQAIAVSAGAASGAGAGTGTWDRMVTRARIGDRALVGSTGGDIAVLATHSATQSNRSIGVAVSSSASLGVSASTARVLSLTEAEIADGASLQVRTAPRADGTFHEGTLRVTASDTSDARTEAIAGTGALLVGANAAVAETTQNARTQARLGDDVTLGSGALALSATSQVRGDAVATGISVGGLLSLGAAIARTNGQTDTDVTVGLRTAYAREGDTITPPSRIGIVADGTSRLLARSLAGSGGIISGAASSAKVLDTGRATVALATGTDADNAVNLRGDRIEVASRYRSNYALHGNAVNASVVGASGTEAEYSNTDAGSGRRSVSTVDVGRYAAIRGVLGVSLSSLNGVDRVPGTASPTDPDSEYVATGAGGGLISGGAVLARQTLRHEAATRVADDVLIGTMGNPYYLPGNVTITARTTSDADLRVKLNTGGAIQAPFTDAHTDLDSQVSATLGERVSILSSGVFALTTSADHKALSEALTKTYGAIGIAGGSSSTVLKVHENVRVGRNTSIFSWDTAHIGAGMSAEGAAANLLGARAITDVYNYAVIPITPELAADGQAIDNATVVLEAGSDIRSVRDVNLKAARGLADAKVQASGHNPYSENTQELTAEGTTLVQYNSSLTVNGRVAAGVRSDVQVRIDGAGQLTYQVSDGGTDAGAAALRTNDGWQVAPLATLADLRGFSPVGVFLKTRLNAAGYLNGLAASENDPVERDRLQRLAGLVNQQTLDAFILPDLRAAGGSITVDASTVNGTGSLRAAGGARISIRNSGESHLILNNIEIPDAASGGRVDFVRGQQGSLSVTRIRTDAKPQIEVISDYTSPQGGKGPVLFAQSGRLPNGVISEINNLTGDVLLRNEWGDIAVTSGVFAATIRQEAPNGAISIGSPNQPYFVGGDPAFAWAAAVAQVARRSAFASDMTPFQIAMIAADDQVRLLTGSPSTSQLQLSEELSGVNREWVYNYANQGEVFRNYFNLNVADPNFGQIPGDYRNTNPATLRWYENRYFFPVYVQVARSSSSGSVFSGANAPSDGSRAGLNGGQLVDLNASILDVNGRISSGVTGNQSVRVNRQATVTVGENQVGVLNCLLDAVCALRAGLTGYIDPRTGQYRLDTMGNGVALAVNAGDRVVPIWFDTSSQTLVTRPMSGGDGGRIVLNGQIINSSRLDANGGTLGLIQLNSGAPQFDIRNETPFKLSVATINTGTLANSTLRITDRLNVSGNQPLTTWYVYNPNPGAGTGFTRYTLRGVPTTLEPPSGLSGEYLGQVGNLSYAPVAGARLNWSRTATIKRDIYNPVAGSNAWWDYRTTDWTFEGAGWVNNQNYSVSIDAGRLGENLALSTSTEVLSSPVYRVDYSANGPATRYFAMVDRIRATQNISVRADTPIPIRTAGAPEGRIQITSQGGIELAGSLLNRTGLTSLEDTSSALGIRNRAGADVTLTARDLLLSARADIGAAPDLSGLSRPLRVDMTLAGEVPVGSLSATSTQGSVWLDVLGPVRLGTLRADAGTARLHAVGSIAATGQVRGAQVDLQSRNGGIHGATPTDFLDLGGGVINAVARQDIRIRNSASEVMRVGEVLSEVGDVYLRSPAGMRDAREETPLDIRSTEEIDAIWKQRLAMFDEAAARDDAVRHTVSPYEQRIRGEYDTWWRLLDAGEVQADGSFRIGRVDESWRQRVRAASSLAQNATDEQVQRYILDQWAQRLRSERGLSAGTAVSDAEVQQFATGLYQRLSRSFSEAWGNDSWQQSAAFRSYDAGFRFDMQSQNSDLFASLTRGSYWGEELLSNQIRAAALNRSSTEVPAPTYTNVSGRRVVLDVGGATGSVGRYIDNLRVDLYNPDGTTRTLTDLERQALLLASSPGDLETVNGSNGRPAAFIVRQNRPLIVRATEGLDATAGLNVVLTARGSLPVERIEARTGQVRVAAEEGIVRALGATGTAVRAGSGGIILNAGRGAIGTESQALTLAGQAGQDLRLIQARAGGNVNLQRVDDGNLVFDELTSGDRLQVTVGQGDLLASADALDIAAHRIDLSVAGGRVGSVDPAGHARWLVSRAAGGTAEGSLSFQVRDGFALELAAGSQGLRITDQGAQSSRAGSIDWRVPDTATGDGLDLTLDTALALAQGMRLRGEADLRITQQGSVTAAAGDIDLAFARLRSERTGGLDLDAQGTGAEGQLRLRASEGDVFIAGLAGRTLSVDAVGRIEGRDGAVHLQARESVDLNGAGGGSGIGTSAARPLVVDAPTVAASSASGDVWLSLRGASVRAERLSAQGTLDVLAQGALQITADAQAGNDLRLQAGGDIDMRDATSQQGSITIATPGELRFGALLAPAPTAAITVRTGGSIIGDRIESGDLIDLRSGNALQVGNLTGRRVRVDTQAALSIDVLRTEEASLFSATELSLREGRIQRRIDLGAPRVQAGIVHTGGPAPLLFTLGGYQPGSVADVARLNVASGAGIRSTGVRVSDAVFDFSAPSYALEDVYALNRLEVNHAGVRVVADNRAPDVSDPRTDLFLYEPDARFALFGRNGAVFTTSYVLKGLQGLPVFMSNYNLPHTDADLLTYGTTVLTVKGLLATQQHTGGLSSLGSVPGLFPSYLPRPQMPRPQMQPPASGPALRASANDSVEVSLAPQ